MKLPVTQWFEQQSPRSGLLAAALRGADKSTTAKSWNTEFGRDAIENAMRCVADVYQVLQLNGVAPARLRFVYRNSWLHCERGTDGSCLGLFTEPDVRKFEGMAGDKLFKEFQILCALKRA